MTRRPSYLPSLARRRVETPVPVVHTTGHLMAILADGKRTATERCYADMELRLLATGPCKR